MRRRRRPCAPPAIRVHSTPFGDFTAGVAADTELRAPVDAVLITVKHTALDAALARVPASALGADTLLVPFLNGVEHPALLRARYGPDRVAPAVVRVESTRVAPGVIEHGSGFAEIDLTGDAVPRPRLDALARVLQAAYPPSASCRTRRPPCGRRWPSWRRSPCSPPGTVCRWARSAPGTARN